MKTATRLPDLLDYPWKGRIEFRDLSRPPEPEELGKPIKSMTVAAVLPFVPFRPLTGATLRGFVDVMTVRGPGSRGMWSAFSVISGEGRPVFRAYVPRIFVTASMIQVDGWRVSPGAQKPRSAWRVEGTAAGPWVRSTKWDPWVVPVADDGDVASLCALADAMAEQDAPEAAAVRELVDRAQGDGCFRLHLRDNLTISLNAILGGSPDAA